jgi:hypothetical protein
LVIIDTKTGVVHSLLPDTCDQLGKPCYLLLAWSPDGRYLAYSRSTIDSGNAATTELWLWHASNGKISLLTSNFTASLGLGGVEWSHSDRYLAISVGPAGNDNDMNLTGPRTEKIDLERGPPTQIGIGIPDGWSPDDRFLAIRKPTAWTSANGYWGTVSLLSVPNGRMRVLGQYSEIFGTDQWTVSLAGYTYAGWVLDKAGQVVRTVTPGFAVSWSPNGSFVLIQRGAQLTLETRLGRTSVVQMGSDSIITPELQHASYVTAWAPDQNTFAYSTPFLGPNLQIGTVRPNGSLGVRTVSIADPIVKPLQFTADGRYLLVTISRTSPHTVLNVYRYSLTEHSLTLLTTGAVASALQPATPQPKPLDSLIAAVEHLRVTSDQSLDSLEAGDGQLLKAVHYFHQHLGTDALQGAATVILDALSANSAAKDLWQGSLNDFLKQQSLTNSKALLAGTAKNLGKDAAIHLAKAGYDRLTAVLIDWLITGDPRAQQLLTSQIKADKRQIDDDAKQAEAALRAHPPSTAQAHVMEAALASVSSANNRIAGQIGPLTNLLTTSYALRQATDQDKTVFDNFFADTALTWGLTALSAPVGGWGGLAYKGTKLAFQGLQVLGKVAQDAQLVTSGAAAGLARIPLAGSVTTNADVLLKDMANGTAPTTPTGTITHLAGTEQAGLRRPAKAMLTVTVRAGKGGGRYQAVVTYQHTSYTLPIPQGAYPVTYLAKSPPVELRGGATGTLKVNFLPGGSGTPPSTGTGMTITVLALQGNRTYYIGQTSAIWRPS